MHEERYDLYLKIINKIDEANSLINEYDSQLHNYNGVELYQAESQMIKLIGDSPGISAYRCSKILNKTSSASSQIIKKLKNKGWVIQKLNQDNNRKYNLYLTEEGKVIYENHRNFEQRCYQRSYDLLKDFNDEDFRKFIEIQKVINNGFVLDIEDGKVNKISKNNNGK